MKRKYVWLALALCLIVGCHKQTSEPQKIEMLVPQGAPALATLSVFNTDYANVTTVAGSDVITAELAKQDGYDVIIAPINLGAKMLESESSVYRLKAVITWGNLYIVATDTYQNGDPFAAFGENAVPGKILNRAGLHESITYYNSVQDVQAQLLSGKAKAGLLAEPALSATLAKAKEQGIRLSIIRDIQNDENSGETKGYPQAAIFVKQGSETNSANAIAEIERFLREDVQNTERITTLITDAGVENLGVPSAQLAITSWERQNIRFVNAADVKDEIETFLSLFDIRFDESMLSE